MATKFADLAKPAKSLLNDDYTSKVSLKCKKDAGAVGVTIETEQGDGGALSSKIATKFSYAKFTVDKGQLTADGGRVLETSLVPCPPVKLTFKANKGADLGVEYTKGNLMATATLDVMDMSSLGTSACFGVNPSLKVGGDALVGLNGGGLKSINVGASYVTGSLFTAVTAAPTKKQATLSLKYTVNSKLELASQTTHASEKVCTVGGVGGAYKMSCGTLKAKYCGKGLVHACFIREIAPKVTLTASGSCIPTDMSTFKPGLAISM